MLPMFAYSFSVVDLLIIIDGLVYLLTVSLHVTVDFIARLFTNIQSNFNAVLLLGVQALHCV